LLGITLAVSYWLIETVADSVFGGEGPVATRLFPADANEVWMRLIIVALILGFTGYVSRTLQRRSRTERRLRVLQSAVEQTDDAVLITTAKLDPPGPEIVYVNEALCRQTGYAAKELLGETPRKLQGPDSDREVLDELGRCLERKQHFVGSLTNYRKDGSSFRVELRISPVYDAAKNVTHWISVQHDITERERAEAALKESEEHYRLLIESAEDYAIFMADPVGRILSWNSGAERLYGYSAEEAVGRPVVSLLVPPDRREEVAGIYTRLREGERVRHETVRVAKGGRLLEVALTVSPIRDGRGDVVGAATIARDVTERKRAQEALSRSEERYRAVVEQSAEGLYLVDGGTRRILETNPALQNMLGYTAEELRGMELHEIVAHAREDVEANVERTLREGTRFIREREYRRKDGSVVEVEIAASAIDYGEKRVICAAIRDITERKRAERALREVREAERRQIARDLHDEVLQELMDALYSMQLTRMKLRDEEIDIPEIDEQIDDLRKATNSLRDAINNLRHESIQEQPFLHLLRSVVVANRQKAPHIEMDLDVDASFASRCLGSTGIELLRIIQEALVNVRRHSWARHVRVSLREEEDLPNRRGGGRRAWVRPGDELGRGGDLRHARACLKTGQRAGDPQ
jgi:PAS domain S-box-containing protein